MRAQQQGITLIGWLFLLTPLAIVAYAGVRLAPVYLNYMKVSRSLDALQSEAAPKGEDANATSIKMSLGKQFVIESIQYPTARRTSTSRATGRSWVSRCRVRRPGAAVRQHLPPGCLPQGRADRKLRR